MEIRKVIANLLRERAELRFMKDNLKADIIEGKRPLWHYFALYAALMIQTLENIHSLKDTK